MILLRRVECINKWTKIIDGVADGGVVCLYVMLAPHMCRSKAARETRSFCTGCMLESRQFNEMAQASFMERTCSRIFAAEYQAVQQTIIGYHSWSEMAWTMQEYKTSWTEGASFCKQVESIGCRWLSGPCHLRYHWTDTMKQTRRSKPTSRNAGPIGRQTVLSWVCHQGGIAICRMLRKLQQSLNGLSTRRKKN